LAKLYPSLIQDVNITVYDVAPKVLSMFDERLGKYAEQTFQRDGIKVKTSHHVESLRLGPPKSSMEKEDVADDQACWTLKVKEQGEIGVGMVVWSTGLMTNPFVEKAVGEVHALPRNAVDYLNMDRKNAEEVDWILMKDEKTGGLVTNHQLRVLLEPEGDAKDKPRAVIQVGQNTRLTIHLGTDACLIRMSTPWAIAQSWKANHILLPPKLPRRRPSGLRRG
jgi:hypothetical protein